jgi:DNA replication protein DnaC
MIFMGGTGIGKTHLSTAIAGRVIERGFDVFYSGVANLFSDFEMQRYGNSAGGETGLGTSQYFDSDLLIIDDLGTEVINQFTATVLYNVINTRLSRKKSTIINTNFGQDELRAKYADRITSRIFGEYRVIPFVGKDVRMGKIHRNN